MSNSTLSLVKTPSNAIVVASGVESLRRAWYEANTALDHATRKALYFGFLLIEQRELLAGGRSLRDSTKGDSEKLSIWLEKFLPEIHLRTAQRWMQAAERSAAAAGLTNVIEVEGHVVHMSELVAMPESELPTGAIPFRHQWFAFISDKTINDCIKGVAEGDESHRITRAHNGKHAKGAGGSGNRKNFTGFTAVALRKISTFVTQKLSPAEQAKIVTSFGASMEKWPKWLLKPLAELAAKEMKTSDEERAERITKSK